MMNYPDTATSLIGRPAPSFVAHSTKGMLNLEAFEGSWVLLFCHPADFTPVCTTEFISLAKHKSEFDELGVELIGLSVDSVFSHLNWIEWIEDYAGITVDFPVIEDMSMSVSQAYGMIDGNSVNSASVRACFFIDPDQNIQAVIHYPMQVGRSVEELLRVQKALITTYQNDISVPAGWQPGDEVMETTVNQMMEKPSGWLKRTLEKAFTFHNTNPKT